MVIETLPDFAKAPIALANSFCRLPLPLILCRIPHQIVG